MVEYITYNLKEIAIITLVIALLILSFIHFKSKRNRSIFLFYLNFLLYKIGLKNHISKKYIKMVHVRENYEPLVDLVNHPKIIINDNTIERPVLLRKNVALKLFRVADSLPNDIFLKVYSAYRSRISLYNTWIEEVNKFSEENPDKGRAEILNMANYKQSNPYASLGGHDTGGAIDVALCDKNGTDLDFGTKFHDNVPAIKTKYKHLSEEQKKNRSLLIKLMRSQGFINLPKEWWHFSYGDSTWSAYKGKRFGAIYDAAEKDYENVGYVRIIKTNISTANIK